MKTKEIDLKLFEILDSEIDKTLSEWVIIKVYKSFYKIVEDDDFYFIDYKWEVKYISNSFDWENSDYIILWHYPTTNTVLRYLGKYWHFMIDDRWWIFDKSWNSDCPDDRVFRLDITKEIKDYTDEQKQELYDFLNNL